ncbi:MAG: protein adenylyltransferase SelO, partial [Peptostreptococcaceae bacterium]
MDKINDEVIFNFDNSYIKLPDKFYSKVTLNPVKKPELVIFNYELAKQLNINSTELTSKEGLKILSGSVEVQEGSYIAQAYAGHQFGNFTMLGDGRALLIGEQITTSGDRYDIQLKGSGKTTYSRRGDGRAVLGPMLREYIMSEAMHNLKIPTTRGLAVVKTNKSVIREYVKQGAILTRVSSSHLRFGTFEYASNFGTLEDVKVLADYAINRHYPFIKDDENKYYNFLREVINVQASLVAKWMCVGFIHGVMNTDNMTISGETIDYGPCAFMDTYKSKTVFSSIDTYGRYSYENQPLLAQWNLCRFAETLIPL